MARFTSWAAAATVSGCLAAPAGDLALPPPVAANGLAYTSEIRAEPRPLRIHVLRFDLASRHYEPALVVNADPDGGGPAEATLGDPVAMATEAGLVAAVNASVFAAVPDATGTIGRRWVVGMPVDVLGWTVADGIERSPRDDHYPHVWIDAAGKAGVGAAGRKPDPKPPRQAATGFQIILRDGRVTAGQGGPLHPRTAAGVDAAGQSLVLAVVDGRQPGTSEGVNEYELAGIMQRLGCHDAVNLDGGGSSVMLLGQLGDDGGRPRVVNAPSDGSPRPLPSLLGIRPRRP